MGAKEFSRAERIADQIQREVADIIARDLADPRVDGVTVSGARVSRDLANATVYVTFRADADASQTLRGLEAASGFLRRKLGERVRLRRLPKLHFVEDTTLDTATRVDALIESAMRDHAPRDDSGEGDT